MVWVKLVGCPTWMISDPGEVSIPGYMPKYGPLVPHFDQYSIQKNASKKKHPMSHICSELMGDNMMII